MLRDRASDLASRQIPASSLVVLHLSSGGGLVGQVPEFRQASVPRIFIGEVDEVDQVPEPGAPLQVAFSVDGNRHIVDVIGLATLRGPSARVPHALKPSFDDDRRNGVAPADYRYTMGTRLPDMGGMNKRTIRKAVERCRKQLAQGYEEIHGEPPVEPLLIQTRVSKGYRLDPYIIVLPANRAP
ncbi:hypothetical protein [Palleronia marisminoris]|uniref:hypothetical protein n=1 Tax=Palleronia marisminoris TaxID=315423 RepID=UPI001C319204|nr:hypothetical protein [Palleronia marisminoris]